MAASETKPYLEVNLFRQHQSAKPLLFRRRRHRAEAQARYSSSADGPRPVPVEIKTGIIRRKGKGNLVVTLRIEAEAVNYAMKWSSWTKKSNTEVLMVLIAANETVETKVPLGRYKLLAATSNDWYGDRLLFGPLPGTSFFGDRVVRSLRPVTMNSNLLWRAIPCTAMTFIGRQRTEALFWPRLSRSVNFSSDEFNEWRSGGIGWHEMQRLSVPADTNSAPSSKPSARTNAQESRLCRNLTGMLKRGVLCKKTISCHMTARGSWFTIAVWILIVPQWLGRPLTLCHGG
jgi:hypothetical protein